MNAPLPIRSSFLVCVILLAVAASLGLPAMADAVVVKAPTPLDAKAWHHIPFYARRAGADIREAGSSIPNAGEWDRFLLEKGPQKVMVQPGSGRVLSVSGTGIPWIPGYGNSLSIGDISTHMTAPMAVPDISVLEAIARDFVSANQALFQIPSDVDFTLNRVASIAVTPVMWNLRFDLSYRGVPIKGGALIFLVKYGNLIVWGTENLGDFDLPLATAITADQARDTIESYVGGFLPGLDRVLGTAQRLILPEQLAAGLGFREVWEVRFDRDNEGSYVGHVDAHSGEILEFYDDNDYAQIRGGIYPVTNTAGTEVIKPLGFADYNAGVYADGGGSFTYPGGTVTSTLFGRYVRINDNCGAISRAASAAPGDIDFGQSAGTDCTTPGFGGAGNTHSARSCYYHVDLIKQKGRVFYPANGWLLGNLTSNVNINNTCNAFWNGSTINFYRSGGGCGNTGEIAAIFLHEWGHGMDSNDGNGAGGSGEGMGDTVAMLQLRDPCIGQNFLGAQCGGYGNACTSCTGVRDQDRLRHVAPEILNPQTINTRCPAGTDPCGQEVHCEGLLPGNTVWDLVFRDFPARPDLNVEDSWALMDKLWWESGTTRNAAYTCGDITPPFLNNGCGASSWYITFKAADDANGNLADGTPHASTIFQAFDRHGISCGLVGDVANQDSPECPAIGDPSTLIAAPGNNTVTLNWTAAASAANYRILRNNQGCAFAFTQIATVAAPTTNYVDTTASNGTAWNYVVQATGVLVDCTGPVSNCATATPVATPAPLISFASAAMVAENCAPPNTVIDPGETVTMNFSLQNVGSLDTTNLVATLLPTGGVTTPSAPQNYGVLLFGGPAVVRAFTFTADPLAACGSTLTATLALQDGVTNLGTVTSNFVLGVLGAPVTSNFSTGAINIAIVDVGTVNVPLNVPTTGVITDIDVRIRLNHTWDSDLDISLIGPDATIIDLSSDNGGSGDNYGSGATNCTGTFTIFNDEAATPITGGVVPFNGSFQPEGLLSSFDGKASNGAWTLRVTDDVGGDTGTIFCFQLDIGIAQLSCCVAAPGSTDLGVVKTDSPDPVAAGGTLTYTVTATNSGPDNATGVTVTDTLPAGVGFVSATPSQGSCIEAGGVVTCTIGAMLNGGSATIVIVVTAPAVGPLSNSVSISGAEADPNPANNTDTEATTVTVLSADLGVTKTDSPDPVAAGGALTYTVTATNSGPDAATGVTVVDTLPAGVGFVSATPSQGSCSQAGGVVNCNVGALANGGSATIVIVVTAPLVGPLNNSVSISGAEADPNPANNSDTEATTVTASTDLVVTKTDSPDPVVAGATLTYTVTASNAGPSDATGVTVVDTLPAGVVFVSATPTQGTCLEAGGVVTCNIGALANGVSATISIVVTAPSAAGSINNQATISGAENDPDPSDNSDTEATTVTASTDLVVTKTDSPDPVAAGATLTYTVTASNTGPSDATGVTVVDTLPAGVVFVSATPTQGTCLEAGGVVTCNIGALANGASATISIVVTAPSAAGSINNQATISGAENDPDPSDNSDTEATTVTDPCAGETVAPVVTPPASTTVDASICVGNLPGATGNSSAPLAAFIAGGSATDNCDLTPTQLPAQVGGVDIDNTTFFPIGTTTVTFRFMDDAGNIGSATADVTVDVFYGDLNEDDLINAGDSVILANFLVGNLTQGVPPFTAPLAAADLNNAGGVNSVDSVILANFLVGNITCLPQ